MLVAIGECMVEIAPAGDGNYQFGYAGDTFNAAWACKMLSPADDAVRYVTAIGTDWISDQLLEFVAGSGLDLSAVTRDPARSVGLYAVKLDNGERSFAYWRSGSAATALADDTDFLESSLQGASHALFSGITLAILPPNGRRNLYQALSKARDRGTRIVLDSNYRARLWPSAAMARAELTKFSEISDCVLPSFSDEAELFGDTNPEMTADRFADLGVDEVIVKNGSAPALCVWGEHREFVPSILVDQVVDTTGAGDAFNGAYLAARSQGMVPSVAAAFAHDVAAISVQTRGALIPRDTRQRLVGRTR
ncbi:MAG: sugar kinase [Janthinobacterium lividum]